MKANELAAGDTITRWTYRRDGQGMGVNVTILTAPEPHTDPTGLPVLKMWARRDDDMSEGWVIYGPDAEVAA